MNSLFWKIFLWFWLFIVVLIAVLLIAHELERAGSTSEAALETLLDFLGQTAVALREKEGPAAAAQFLDNLGPSASVKAFLFSTDGRELTNRPAPAGARKIAAQKFQKTSREAPFVAHRFVGGDARPYVLIVQNLQLENTGSPVERWYRNWSGPASLLKSSSLSKLGPLLIIAAMVCWWLARHLSRPLARLKAATRQFAKGNLSIRAAPEVSSRHDELTELSTDFDRMADRIESLVASQRRLIRDIAHELRSPLARLQVALELARADAGFEGQIALRRVEVEANRLNEMIQQLLDLARLESATEEIKTEQVDLSALLEEVVEDAAFEAAGKNISVKLTSVDLCRIHGAAHMVRSAIDNVLRNAIRYTPDNSSVQVTLTCEGTQAAISIADHGPGVPEPELKEIFNPFYRVAKSRDRTTGGTGLGLAITNRVVQSHGGSVSARNRPEGGLMLTIRLPAL